MKSIKRLKKDKQEVFKPQKNNRPFSPQNPLISRGNYKITNTVSRNENKFNVNLMLIISFNM